MLLQAALDLEPVSSKKIIGESWKQFFNDVQGHRQPLERTPVETGCHRGGRWRE